MKYELAGTGRATGDGHPNPWVGEDLTEIKKTIEGKVMDKIRGVAELVDAPLTDGGDGLERNRSLCRFESYLLDHKSNIKPL